MDQVRLKVEALDERIAPDIFGAPHNNPDNANNNNERKAGPNGALPQGQAGN
jgi:hypothetical protein